MNLIAAWRDRGYSPAPTPRTGLPETPDASVSSAAWAHAARPSSVDASDWDRLVGEVSRVLCDGGTVDRQLHHAVHSVVAAMRQARAPWESVYFALASSLEPCETPHSPTPRAMERHPTRGAALVAHMHCWADCVRLEEIERGA